MGKDNSEDGLKRGCGATPLLFLLDGVLSEDECRVEEALAEIERLGCPCPPPTSSSPCFCKEALVEVLSSLLSRYPDMAAFPSEHDGSLPLHFAASLGYVPAAKIILSKVRDDR